MMMMMMMITIIVMKIMIRIIKRTNKNYRKLRLAVFEAGLRKKRKIF